MLGTPSDLDQSFITDKSAVKYLRDHGAGRRGGALSQRLPHASQEALDLLGRMLEFNPFLRPTIEECISHPFFDKIRNPATLAINPNIIDLVIDHEDQSVTMADLRTIIQQEMAFFKAKRMREGPWHINNTC